MGTPTTRFRQIPRSTSATALNKASKRLAAISGETEISTGAGNELILGYADISDGDGASDVAVLLWDVTANGGNTIVKDFMIWLDSNGFDEADTLLKMCPLSGADQAAPVNTENYIANAVVSSFSWANMPEANPGAINLYPSDEGSSMSIAGGTSDDVIMVAIYAFVDESETNGIFKGLDAGNELRLNFEYTYS
jgi:hypothetical protein